MSLRIAPPSSNQSTTSNTTIPTSTSTSTSNPSNLPKGAPSAPGLPDTLRSSSLSTKSTADTTTTADPHPSLPSSSHPLESRLRSWTATQDNLKHEILRRTYGVAEPVRRGMELKLVHDGDWRPVALGGSGGVSVHKDVLTGRDCEVSWEDVWTDAGRVAGGGVGGGHGGDCGVHDEMEDKVGMWKW